MNNSCYYFLIAGKQFSTNFLTSWTHTIEYLKDENIDFWTKTFNKLSNFRNLFTNRRKFFIKDNHTVFSGDGHPWKKGTTLMAELLATKI